MRKEASRTFLRQVARLAPIRPAPRDSWQGPGRPVSPAWHSVIHVARNIGTNPFGAPYFCPLDVDIDIDLDLDLDLDVDLDTDEI